MKEICIYFFLARTFFRDHYKKKPLLAGKKPARRGWNKQLPSSGITQHPGHSGPKNHICG